MKKTSTIFILLLSLLTGLSKAQTNLDLQTWSGTVPTPTGWQALLNPYYSFTGDTSVTKGTGQSGFGAKLWPVDLTALGVSAAGSFLQYGTNGKGIAYTTRPDSVQYYYQCNNTNIATEVNIYLTRYNSITLTIDTIARSENAYTGVINSTFVFEKQKLVYDLINGNLNPDSLKINIVAVSDIPTANLHTAYFAVDEFQFKGTAAIATGLTNYSNTSSMKIYPTIVTNNINFEFENSNFRFITIYNVTGKEILNEKTNDKHHSLNLSSIESGYYIYKVSDANNNSLKTGKFVVSHN